jgi:hypothetical protein
MQRDLVRDGLVRCPMLDPGQVQELLAQLAALQPDDRFAPEGTDVSYHCSFLDANRDYRRAVAEMARRAVAPVVESVLVDYEVLQANFYVKPSGAGEIGLHQNWPALTSLDDTSLTVWCPLVDVDPANGALRYVPGSHKLLPQVQGPESTSYFEQVLPRIDDLVETLTLRAGEGAIFDDGLIHGSERNTSSAARIALQVICVPRDETPVFYFRADGATFELIEAPPEFWLAHDLADLRRRQPGWSSLGFVRSRNRDLDEAELRRLLAVPPAERPSIALEPTQAPAPGRRRRWRSR